MPQVINIPGHGLPMELLAKKAVYELGPDQFAFLMMMAANPQGARAAFWSTEGRLVQVTMPSQRN